MAAAQRMQSIGCCGTRRVGLLKGGCPSAGLPLSVVISSLSAKLAESRWATQQNGSSGRQLAGMLSGVNERLCVKAPGRLVGRFS